MAAAVPTSKNGWTFRVTEVRISLTAGSVGGMPDEPAQEPEAPVEPVVEPVIDPMRTPPPTEPVDTGYTPSGVPTFESVREKIETRYGTAIGAAELDAETPEGRTIEEQYEARQRAAAERLAQIRESMRNPDSQ
ncbi:hypothetical protein MMOR_31430 [Mycolicibacterium moriokaense]|uniref:PspA domain-containing protein n=2 Tax=Mycolicibacterium moriokaense TaxID=39691 RepID=A0AAD1M606_9MYCO|nr:hypothetical protein MMOR_31430 [Mycolicibacterium moriokaense]